MLERNLLALVGALALIHLLCQIGLTSAISLAPVHALRDSRCFAPPFITLRLKGGSNPEAGSGSGANDEVLPDDDATAATDTSNLAKDLIEDFTSGTAGGCARREISP